MKKGRLQVLLFCLLFYVLVGCAGQSVDQGQDAMPPVEPVQKLSHAEQKEQAYEVFKQILDLSNSPDRLENLPRIKGLYREIMDKYPDVGLAQECYLRLVILAKQEETESGDKEAEQLYQEFLQKYPESKLKPIIASELKK
jgi:hypothetical protein